MPNTDKNNLVVIETTQENPLNLETPIAVFVVKEGELIRAKYYPDTDPKALERANNFANYFNN